MIPSSVLLLKRVTDLFISFSVLILFSPIMVIMTIMIYLESPGPVIFKQVRLGKDGKRFIIYKFRTMRPDDGFGNIFTQLDDSRILKCGLLFRNTRLDELLNLVNVIKGDMSVIGPRADSADLYSAVEHRIPEIKSRLVVKPGITGLAQLELRSDGSPASGHHLLDKFSRDDFEGPLTIRYKLEYDNEYIKSLSSLKSWIKMDLRIIFKTPYIMFFRQNTI